MTHERGNILFLILLAVVLFAALSYAVTSSMRGGGKDASDEQAKALAATLIQQGTELANAATRLKLINDCKNTELSFENDIVAGYSNSSAPVSKKCHFFDPAGAGMAWPAADSELFIPYADFDSGWIQNAGKFMFTGTIPVKNIGLTDTTPASNELVIYIPFITEKVCNAINASIGISIPPAEQIANFTGGDMHKFGPSGYDTLNNGILEQIGNENATNGQNVAGQSYGCITRADTGGTPPAHHAYYHVLVAR